MESASKPAGKGKTIRVWNPEKTVPQNLQFDKVSVGTSMDDFEEFINSQKPAPKKPEGNPSEVVDLVSRIKSSLILYLTVYTLR